MRQSTNLNHIKSKTALGLIVVILFFAIATPALADYFGPDRTVTEASSICKVVLYECQYIESKNAWKYHKVDNWSCASESKPWLAYPSSPSSMGCFDVTAGNTYWSKEQVLQEVTITHPPATINNSLQNCNLSNGWCNTAPELALNGTEPLPGYDILAIEGSLNGQSFACSGATCNVPLGEGNNEFTFWALSSWGDSSEMVTFSTLVDTVPPTLGLDITASNGTNGWYVSQTSVTATGSDSTSGLSSVLLSVDNGPWESSTTLNEGVYNVDVQAEDVAGNISNTSSTISIDTTTPSIDLSINGATGKNGWYVSNLEVTASATDAISGVRAFEVSSDGNSYINYNSPITFSDGTHTIQFKATDNAGNLTETSTQEFLIDASAPAVDLPAAWEVNEAIVYQVQDAGSGLSSLRVVIEDEDERYAKVVWKQTVSGAKYTGEINWDGKFADNTIAPPGEYHVWIKASDAAGNESFTLGIVTIPSPLSLFDFSPTEKSPASTPMPPKELFDEEEIPSENISSPVVSFGGSTSQVKELESTSFTVTPSTPLTSSTTNSSLLWGMAAAAVVGSATTYALEEKRKREEEETRQKAQVRAEVEATNAAIHASQQTQWEAQKIQNWMDGQDILNAHIEAAKNQGATDKQISELKKMSTEKGLGVAIGGAVKLNQNLHNIAVQDARLEMKMSRYQVEDEIAWQEAEDAKKAVDLQAGLAAYYSATKQGMDEKIPQESNWWEETKSFVQTGIIQPANVYIVQPVLKPAIEKTGETLAVGLSWVDKNAYQPFAVPLLDSVRQTASDSITWMNNNWYQPIKPEIDKILDEIQTSISWVNDTLYQPHIKPLINKTAEEIRTGLSWASEKFYIPIVKPVVDAIENVVSPVTSWVEENIYKPYLQPVVSDFNKYIYEPIATAFLRTWTKYGEWVHGLLDTVGLIPGLGEIADGINGLIYLGEGRYLEAGIAALAMIPLLGDLGKAGKWTVKAGAEVLGEAVEKVAKEAAEVVAEKVAKETAEEIIEKTIMEASEEVLKIATKETAESIVSESVEKIAKEATAELGNVAENGIFSKIWGRESLSPTSH